MDNLFCNYRPQNYKPRRTRLVEAGNLTSFLGDASSVTVEIATEKIFFNSTNSTEGGRFLML